MRTPLHPNGWPMAIAPPFTFTSSGFNPRSLMQASDCDAKASFSSTNPKIRNFQDLHALMPFA
jgi:hypothetical protein